MAVLISPIMLGLGASAIAIGNGGSEVLRLSPSNILPPAVVLPTSINSSLSSFNESAAIVPVDNPNGYAFTCAGPTYGFFQDAEISACLDANSMIASGQDRIRFVERDTPEMTPDAFPLPWRWMDSRST